MEYEVKLERDYNPEKLKKEIRQKIDKTVRDEIIATSTYFHKIALENTPVVSGGFIANHYWGVGSNQVKITMPDTSAPYKQNVKVKLGLEPRRKANEAIATKSLQNMHKLLNFSPYQLVWITNGWRSDMNPEWREFPNDTIGPIDFDMLEYGKQSATRARTPAYGIYRIAEVKTEAFVMKRRNKFK